MKLLFLTGFLEPGKCGVGDYTRRLAAEIIRQGNSCAIVALNDVFIEQEFEGVQHSDQNEILVYRLPSNTTEKLRFLKARQWIDVYNPDWISLQLVLFSFNEKGLPFGLAEKLSPLIGGRNFEIMFHELWLGMEREAKLKIALWGWVQKLMIRKIIKELKPKVLHTQTKLHISELKQLGFQAKLLPLISNIPIFSDRNKRSFNAKQDISIAIFGSVYFGAPVAEFAREIRDYSKGSGSTVTIIAVGRNRKSSESLIEIGKNEGISVKILGEQTEAQISEVLANATFGISTTPFLLSEKSGTVIAMREHGLPVICVSREYNPRRFKGALTTLDGVARYIPGKLETCLAELRCTKPINHRVGKIAAQFIKSLTNNKVARKSVLTTR